jgi:hypothetical protein
MDIKLLSEFNQKQLASYDCLDYNISGTAYLEGWDIVYDTVQLNFDQYGVPQLLYKYQAKPIQYVRYYYYDNGINKQLHVQKNGFLVYTAPSGDGKTYFATKNSKALSNQFDTILYINFELSIDDVKNRYEEHSMEIPENMYIAPLDNVEVIKQWAQDKGSCCFIIDNIDNLVGSGDDAFGAQYEFMKHLDRFLKDFNHHALVLTQLVKDNKLKLISSDGEISDHITYNSLSGVKQLTYLSRSVFMTAYSPVLKEYQYKILKVGSAKTWENMKQ